MIGSQALYDSIDPATIQRCGDDTSISITSHTEPLEKLPAHVFSELVYELERLTDDG